MTWDTGESLSRAHRARKKKLAAGTGIALDSRIAMTLLAAQILPRMLRMQQHFPQRPVLDIAAVVRVEVARMRPHLKPGQRVAVAVGSRGIARLAQVVRALLDELRAAGVQPFIVPAMGSHGGATPEGQLHVLADYGVTEASMGVPIHAAMDAVNLGRTPDGLSALCSAEALRADGIIIVNRVKPHTDYSSRTLGSGLIKMLVVGLGKHAGAANFHRSAVHVGYEAALRAIGRVVLARAPVLFGLALVEHQYHDLARIEAVSAADIEQREGELFAESRELLPRLPFEEMDLLIIDRIGKNISGPGMDPNVIGRRSHAYSTLLSNELDVHPFIRRIFVRGLTPETHGNAIGIGMADATTERLATQMDRHITQINAQTSLTLHSAKLPIVFANDRDAVASMIDTLAMDDVRQARVVRIADTLSMEWMEVSEAFAAEIATRTDITATTAPAAMEFDAQGNLPDLCTASAAAH